MEKVLRQDLEMESQRLDLVVMLAVVVLTGFAVTTMQIIGNNDLSYNEIGVSLFSLFGGVLNNMQLPSFNSGGPSLAQTMGGVMVGVYGVTMSILLVNLLIAMMGNTYNTVKADALGHWAVAFTQTVLYYEKPVWIPPFNLLQEAMSLVIFLVDKFTCGHFTRLTTLETVEIGALLGNDVARGVSGIQSLLPTTTTSRESIVANPGYSKKRHIEITEEVLWQIVSVPNYDNSDVSPHSKRPLRARFPAHEIDSTEPGSRKRKAKDYERALNNPYWDT